MAGVVVPRNFKLIDDLEKAEKDPVPGISLGLESYDDIMLCKWNSTIFGPSSTPFEGRIISLALEAPMEYPQVPPSVRFLTKVNMDCVDGSGRVRLQSVMQWDPSKGLFDVLVAIRNAMGAPANRKKQPPEGECY